MSKYVLVVQVDDTIPFEARIVFTMPGQVTDTDVIAVARKILAGYKDVYATRVRHGGLLETEMTRELVAAGAPIPTTSTTTVTATTGKV